MSQSSEPKNRLFQAKQVLLVASVIAAIFASPSVASAEPETKAGQPANHVNYPIKSRLLGEVLKGIASKSGINFRLAEGLKREKVTATLSGKDWSEASKTLLKGYNYAVEIGKNGAWETVTISGKNGDGKMVSSGVKFQTYSRPQKTDLPARFQGLNDGSVTPITLPLATLKGMKPGKKISLALPSGTSSFVHDNRFDHKNGDITWVGYQENEGQPSRAMITMGKYGPMGHIVTAAGTYQIITEEGQTYLVDVDASGLQSGSLLEDQATGNPDTGGAGTGPIVLGGGGSYNKVSSAANLQAYPHPSSNTAGTAGNALNPASFTTIDLLVLYTKGLAQPETRVNYLADLTNQAYLDSKINAKVRVVRIEAVEYGETGDNSKALSDLTNGTAPFGKAQALREKYGADLVTLIRPFHAGSQQGCGIAWVNGDNGSALSSYLGYSVISDGGDQDGQLVYCGEHTLAHELGHNLGNVHDRPFTNTAGAFSYSYAWGVDGSFGTIMSYLRPSVLLFATPLLNNACRGQPCGYPEGDPNASDNAATINQTAPIVAGFLPTVVPDKN
ncbi:MAG: reprolysin-like metallopeptidase [Candidatus Methylumidiphilus sp.]